jgi:hypothetical protein
MCTSDSKKVRYNICFLHNGYRINKCPVTRDARTAIE